MFVALLNGSVDGPKAEIETVLLKSAVSFVFCYVVVVVHLLARRLVSQSM